MLRTIFYLLFLGAASVCAFADTFKLNFNDGAENQLTLTGNVSTLTAGAYLITSATGTVDGYSATLAPAGTYGSNDNLLLFPANPAYLDFNGLSFALGNTGTYYNLYYNSNPLLLGYRYSVTGNAAYAINSLSVTRDAVTPPVSATPEPSSFGLLTTGVLGIAGAIRRRVLA